MVEQYWLAQTSKVMTGNKDESIIGKQVDKYPSSPKHCLYETIDVCKHTQVSIMACMPVYRLIYFCHSG